MKRKNRIKNGVTQYLHMRAAEIPLHNADERIIKMNHSDLKADSKGLLRLPRSTMIVGNGFYNGAWHPTEELAKSYKSFDRQPSNNNHSMNIEDEVGFWDDVTYKNDKLSGIPIVNLNTANSKATLGYIKNRMLAGKPAELSVGFWCSENYEDFEYDGKEYVNQLVVRDVDGDHCAFVTRGACGPDDGAGVGLMENNDNADITIEYMENGEYNIIKNKKKIVDKEDLDMSKEDEKTPEKDEKKISDDKVDTPKDNDKANIKYMSEDDVATLISELETKNEDVIQKLEGRISEFEKSQAERQTMTRDDYMKLDDEGKAKARTKTGMAIMAHLKEGHGLNLKYEGTYP